MTRLEPKKSVLKDLAIRSKNKCAFPRCDHTILDSKDNYIAELCHIEAANPDGPRYNTSQSDEDRRAYSNLMFMCHKHHKETDNESIYTVELLKKIKSDHENLPEVIFDHELLLQKIEEVLLGQAEITEKIQTGNAKIPLESFSIVGPFIEEAWTPEDGRFYECKIKPGSRYKLLMKDGWLHIEHMLSDGAIAYYEVNEKGDVRNSKFPYPINEYHVEIPEALILSREPVHATLGTRAIKTTLKWSAGTVIEYFQGNMFVGADCHARSVTNHQTRTIRILDKK